MRYSYFLRKLNWSFLGFPPEQEESRDQSAGPDRASALPRLHRESDTQIQRSLDGLVKDIRFRQAEPGGAVDSSLTDSTVDELLQQIDQHVGPGKPATVKKEEPDAEVEPAGGRGDGTSVVERIDGFLRSEEERSILPQERDDASASTSFGVEDPGVSQLNLSDTDVRDLLGTTFLGKDQGAGAKPLSMTDIEGLLEEESVPRGVDNDVMRVTRGEDPSERASSLEDDDAELTVLEEPEAKIDVPTDEEQKKIREANLDGVAQPAGQLPGSDVLPRKAGGIAQPTLQMDEIKPRRGEKPDSVIQRMLGQEKPPHRAASENQSTRLTPASRAGLRPRTRKDQLMERVLGAQSPEEQRAAMDRLVAVVLEQQRQSDLGGQSAAASFSQTDISEILEEVARHKEDSGRELLAQFVDDLEAGRGEELKQTVITQDVAVGVGEDLPDWRQQPAQAAEAPVDDVPAADEADVEAEAPVSESVDEFDALLAEARAQQTDGSEVDSMVDSTVVPEPAAESMVATEHGSEGEETPQAADEAVRDASSDPHVLEPAVATQSSVEPGAEESEAMDEFDRLLARSENEAGHGAEEVHGQVIEEAPEEEDDFSDFSNYIAVDADSGDPLDALFDKSAGGDVISRILGRNAQSAAAHDSEKTARVHQPGSYRKNILDVDINSNDMLAEDEEIRREHKTIMSIATLHDILRREDAGRQKTTEIRPSQVVFVREESPVEVARQKTSVFSRVRRAVGAKAKAVSFKAARKIDSAVAPLFPKWEGSLFSEDNRVPFLLSCLEAAGILLIVSSVIALPVYLLG